MQELLEIGSTEANKEIPFKTVLNNSWIIETQGVLHSGGLSQFWVPVSEYNHLYLRFTIKNYRAVAGREVINSHRSLYVFLWRIFKHRALKIQNSKWKILLRFVTNISSYLRSCEQKTFFSRYWMELKQFVLVLKSWGLCNVKYDYWANIS